MCHCLACQKRTGSVCGVQARSPRSQVTGIEGRTMRFTRSADGGNSVTFRFCPLCGSTVFWERSGDPEVIAIAVGSFADPQFPEPRISAHEASRHSWAMRPAGLDMEHLE
jgi:hypothetical protein